MSVGGGSGGGSQGSSSLTPAIVATQRSSDISISNSNLSTYNNVMSLTINPTVSGSKILITAGGGLLGHLDNDDESNTDNHAAAIEVQIFRGSSTVGQSAFGGVDSTSFPRNQQQNGIYIAVVDTNNHGGNNVTYTIKARMTKNFLGTTSSGKVRKGFSLMLQEIF